MIEFNFWLLGGKIYVASPKVLPFQLVIPLVKLDRQYFGNWNATHKMHPIQFLFESHSARWACIKYYMATAADVQEGCSLDMTTFVDGVTDHEDHHARYITTTNDNDNTDDTTTTTSNNTDSKIVYIDMQDEIDTNIVPDIPRDDTKIHRFFFSW